MMRPSSSLRSMGVSPCAAALRSSPPQDARWPGAGLREAHWALVYEAMRSVLLRDLRSALRRRSDLVASLVFFVVVCSLVPLGVGAEPHLLRSIAAGVVWVAALLASMLSLSRLFTDDWQDGTLDLMLASVAPLPLLILARMAAHWLTTGLLIAAVCPALALAFDVDPHATAVMFASLLLGTPVLSLIGGVGAALTLGARGGGLLLSLLTLPLVVPVLVFGAGAVSAAQGGQDVGAHLSILGAMWAASLFLAPLAAAAALRIATE